MDIILITAQRIPVEDRAALIEKIDKTRRQIYFSQADMEYFFAVWNTHISPREHERITCPACRSKVVSRLRAYVEKLKTLSSDEQEKDS